MNNDNKNQEYNSSICYTVTFNFFSVIFFAREWLNSKLVAYIFGEPFLLSKLPIHGNFCGLQRTNYNKRKEGKLWSWQCCLKAKYHGPCGVLHSINFLASKWVKRPSCHWPSQIVCSTYKVKTIATTKIFFLSSILFMYVRNEIIVGLKLPSMNHHIQFILIVNVDL